MEVLRKPDEFLTPTESIWNLTELLNSFEHNTPSDPLFNPEGCMAEVIRAHEDVFDSLSAPGLINRVDPRGASTLSLIKHLDIELKLAKEAYRSRDSGAGRAEEPRHSSAVSDVKEKGKASAVRDVKGKGGAEGATVGKLSQCGRQAIPFSKQGSSGSSREGSADEDGEIHQNLEPADLKRARRMLSNRESAKRSREKKEGVLADLGHTVEELLRKKKVQEAEFNECRSKLSNAVRDNELLKANVRTLQAQVKMAEMVIAGQSQSHALAANVPSSWSTQSHSLSGNVPSSSNTVNHNWSVPSHSHGLPVNMSMSSNAVNPNWSTQSPAHALPANVPSSSNAVNPNWYEMPAYNQGFLPPSHASASFQALPADGNYFQAPLAEQEGSRKMGRTPSMQHVASCEHLKKRGRGGFPGESLSVWESWPSAGLGSN